MSPPQSNETPSLTPDDAISALEEAETGILCETSSGKLPVRHRRDIASGDPVATEAMIRFVVSPDGQLVPDILHKLPGRGLWVRAERASLETAIKKNIFSKAAKRQVKADSALPDRVHGLLRRRCLDLLGLARREGGLVSGFEKVLIAAKSGQAAWLIEASDGAEDGRKRILAAARAASQAAGTRPNLCASFNNAELSLALGLENAIHVALLSGRRVERWSSEMKRLSGFESLVPEAWDSQPGPAG